MVLGVVLNAETQKRKVLISEGAKDTEKMFGSVLFAFL